MISHNIRVFKYKYGDFFYKYIWKRTNNQWGLVKYTEEFWLLWQSKFNWDFWDNLYYSLEMDCFWFHFEFILNLVKFWIRLDFEREIQIVSVVVVMTSVGRASIGDTACVDLLFLIWFLRTATTDHQRASKE